MVYSWSKNSQQVILTSLISFHCVTSMPLKDESECGLWRHLKPDVPWLKEQNMPWTYCSLWPTFLLTIIKFHIFVTCNETEGVTESISSLLHKDNDNILILGYSPFLCSTITVLFSWQSPNKCNPVPVCTLSWCNVNTTVINNEMVPGSERFSEHYRKICQSLDFKEKQEQLHAFFFSSHEACMRCCFCHKYHQKRFALLQHAIMLLGIFPYQIPSVAVADFKKI